MQRLQRKDCPEGERVQGLGCRGKRGNDRVELRKVSLGTMRECFGCHAGKIYPVGNGVSEGLSRSNMAKYEF